MKTKLAVTVCIILAISIIFLVQGGPSSDIVSQNKFAVRNRAALSVLKQLGYCEDDEFLYDRKKVPFRFAYSLVTAETCARPQLRVRLENLYAKIASAVFGSIPDISLGVAQVKPSTAKTVIEKRVPEFSIALTNEVELVNILTDPCTNFKICREYLDELFEQGGFETFDSIAAITILAQYNGQRSTTKGSVYTDLVLQIDRECLSYEIGKGYRAEYFLLINRGAPSWIN